MNYIILGNVEIFPKRLFSIKKEKKRKGLMECRGYIYIVCQNTTSLKFI
jgi:hypothetical protein